MRRAYVHTRLCLLRWLGIQDVMRIIEAFHQPRYSRSALQPTLAVLPKMTWGTDTGGPWVAWHHLQRGGDDRSVGHFAVAQCPQCHEIVRFRHVHGPSSLSFQEGCACGTEART